MATWAFVADMASATPAVLLDLNQAGLRVGLDWNLSPPQYDKSRVGGPLRHGQQVTRSFAGNRVLSIPLEITQATSDASAQAIENLSRQLAVDNILKVQFGTNPVFFRTFADPEFAASVRGILTQNTSIKLEIEAEPFAYGPRVTVTGSPFTVSNNPAAGTNPCAFDIASVLGDVPTPLLLVATSTGASGAPSGLVNRWAHFATRSRGTPSGYSNVIQAESMTLANSTASVADAAMSNGNRITITPGVTAMSVRASGPFPSGGVSTIEARGLYRVYARIVKTIYTDTWDVQLKYGTSTTDCVANDVVRTPVPAPGNNGPWMVDLGFMPVPAYSDPVSLGYSGVSMKVQMPVVSFWAQRVAGTGNMHVDFLYFTPADESTVICRFPNTDTTYAVDGTTDAGGSVYAVTTALDEILTTASPPQVVGGGGFPELVPGRTNRIHFLRNVDPNGTVDAVFDTTTFAAYYWPRWREFTRP